MPSLPPELINEILLYLPVKSLKRFRCLSKTSRTEIDSSYFIKTHLKKSIDKKIHLKLIIESNYADTHPYAADFDNGLQQAEILDNFPIRPSNCGKNLCRRIRGTCNGLLLIAVNPLPYYEMWEFSLWNPFTHQYRKLPSCPGQLYACDSCGFGYDSASNDYKIVFISDDYEGVDSFRVSVYSLRSNSWKNIEKLYTTHSCINGDGVFVDNVVYWQCSTITDMFHYNEIFGFSLEDDKFFILPLIQNPPRCLSRLEVLDDKLCLVKFTPRVKDFGVYLWRKEGDGVVEGCWEKAFVLEEEGIKDFVTLLSSEKEGKGKVVFYVKGNNFFRYDCEKGIGRYVKVDGKPKCEFYNVRTCWESLVCPNSFHS